MSGITGIIYLDGRPVEQQTITQMAHKMEHRGPDGIHTWREGAVGLGHCMLHITPESLQEQLPHKSPRTTGCIITADARIDNRAALAKSLDLSNEEDVADSDFILAAYEKWGKQCVNHLIGAFAFAIWDPREHQLLCARDQMGIKPFYYYHGPQRLFTFGTEIKSFIYLPAVPRKLNELCVGLYLADAPEDRYTLYESIYRLPPAHTLIVNTGGIQLHRYWELKPQISAAASDEEYVAEFLEIFREAVRARTRSAFPVASQLSGGLDSSAVTAVADEVMGKDRTGKLHTFSLRFSVCKTCDEGPYIDAMLRELDVQAHAIDADQLKPLTRLKEVYELLDDEIANANYFSFCETFSQFSALGGRVVLDGLDGDTAIMHGLLRFGELAQAEEWDDFIEEAVAAQKNHKVVEGEQKFLQFVGSPNWLIKKFALPVLREMATEGRLLALIKAAKALHKGFGVRRRSVWKRFWRRLLVPQFFLQWWDSPITAIKYENIYYINEDFAEAHRLNERAKELKVSDWGRRVRERQAIQYQPHLLARTFEKADHLAAMYATESRHPFMDIRLLSFCLGLPASQSFRAGWSRAILRDAMRGYLPDEVRLRSGKARMSDHVRHGLLEVDVQRLQYLLQRFGSLESFVDTDKVKSLAEQMIKKYVAGAPPDPVSDSRLVILYRIISILERLRTNRLFEGTSEDLYP